MKASYREFPGKWVRYYRCNVPEMPGTDLVVGKLPRVRVSLLLHFNQVFQFISTDGEITEQSSIISEFSRKQFFANQTSDSDDDVIDIDEDFEPPVGDHGTQTHVHMCGHASTCNYNNYMHILHPPKPIQSRS